MIHARTFPRAGDSWLVVGLVAIAALAAVAIGTIVLWVTLRPASSTLGGVITYTTPAGDASVRPDGKAAEAIDGPPVVPVVAAGGLEVFSAPHGGGVAYVERSGADAWLNVRAAGTGTSRRLAQLADASSPPLVDGVKGDAQVVGGVPLVVVWSPDGRYLAYGGLTGAPYTLHVVDGRTLSQQDYVVAGGFIGELAWSAAGDRLAISTYSEDRHDHTVYILDPAGGAPVRLIDGCHIVWSPDSRHLVVRRDPQHSPGVWVVPVNGTEAYALTASENAFPLSWRAE